MTLWLVQHGIYFTSQQRSNRIYRILPDIGPLPSLTSVLAQVFILILKWQIYLNYVSSAGCINLYCINYIVPYVTMHKTLECINTCKNRINLLGDLFWWICINLSRTYKFSADFMFIWAKSMGMQCTYERGSVAILIPTLVLFPF